MKQERGGGRNLRPAAALLRASWWPISDLSSGEVVSTARQLPKSLSLPPSLIYRTLFVRCAASNINPGNRCEEGEEGNSYGITLGEVVGDDLVGALDLDLALSDELVRVCSESVSVGRVSEYTRASARVDRREKANRQVR